MSKFTKGIEIHKQVIHEAILDHKGRCTKSFKADPKCLVCQEEGFISKLSSNTLQSVCKECFGQQNN